MKHVISTEELKGHIEYKPLTYAERIEKSKSILMKAITQDAEKENDSLLDSLDIMKGLYDLVESNSSEVMVEIIAEGEFNGHKITSLDELQNFNEGAAEIQNLGNKLLKGVMLGKPKLKDSEEIAD